MTGLAPARDKDRDSEQTPAAGGTPLPVFDVPALAKGHIPALDGVRGLAALMVLLFHFIANAPATTAFERVVVGVLNYGAFGVELFFVLSGFLITGLLLDARNDPHYFRNFYARRSLRIFPLYYGVLVLVFLVAPLIPAFRGPTLDTLVATQGWAWLYAVNIYLALKGDWAFPYLQHFWSLAVEEHFYLFWPFVVAAFANRPRRLILVCALIAILAIAGRLIGVAAGLSWVATYVLTPFRLDGLALGALIAVVIRQPGGLAVLTRAQLPVTAIAIAVFIATFVWVKVVTGHPTNVVLTIRAGAVQVLLACLLFRVLTAPAHALESRFFRSRPMTTLGTYSYGLYVYHHLISYYLMSNRTEAGLALIVGSHALAVALQAAAAMAVTFAIAYLSYEYFEKPFLKLKSHFSHSKDNQRGPSGSGP